MPPLKNDWANGDFFGATDQNDVANAINQNTTDLAAAVASLAGKADKSTTISAGTGLTGGGDLTSNRTLAADFGSTAGKVCQGNDSRLSDARTPLAHTHSGADINSGTVGYARLPVGTAASTVAAGDDSRITGAVQKSGSATGLWMGSTLPGSGTVGVLYVVTA